MKLNKRLIFLVAVTLLVPGISAAGPCDATFTFDGNLADSSGNVDAGQMITIEGDIVKPVFAEGRSGQSLSLDGTSAMRVMHDLHYDACPQVTISAWINISAATPSRTQYLLSTGSGSGPGIRVSGTSLALNGPANGYMEQRAVRPGAGWQFVAAVYDFDNNTFALYRGNRGAEVMPMTGRRVEWEEAFWVGAWNDSLTGAATGILFDDVRTIGGALSYEQVSQLRNNDFSPAQIPGDQFDPAQIPGDQFDPTQIPGDQFEPTLIPGDQFEPTLIPGDQFEPTLIPGDQFDPTQIPGDQFEPTLIPGDQFEPTLIPGDQFEPDLSSPNILPRTSPDSSVGTVDPNVSADIFDNRDDALAGANILPEPTGADADQATTPPADNTDDATSPQPMNRKPTPVGARLFSGISGFSGQNLNTIDLVDRFATGIRWDEAQNRPCSMAVVPPTGQGDAARLNLGGCGSIVNSLFSGDLIVSLNDDTAIGSIEVCHNGNDNNRLKGIRIVGNRINADGTTTYEPTGAAAQEPNCAVWATTVLCPDQSHATGLVIHSNTSSGNNGEIVGLQLVCRNIGMR